MIFMTIVRYQSISSPSSVLSRPQPYLSSVVCSAGEDEKAGAASIYTCRSGGWSCFGTACLAWWSNRLKLIFGSPLYNSIVYIVTDYIYNFRIVIILNNYNILHFIDRCRCARSKVEGEGKVCGMGGAPSLPHSLPHLIPSPSPFYPLPSSFRPRHI